MKTFQEAREWLLADMRSRGVTDTGALLREAEAVLAEDRRTVAIFVPDGVGWWRWCSYDLPAPVDVIDCAAIELELLNAPLRAVVS